MAAQNKGNLSASALSAAVKGKLRCCRRRRRANIASQCVARRETETAAATSSGGQIEISAADRAGAGALLAFLVREKLGGFAKANILIIIVDIDSSIDISINIFGHELK